MAREGTGWSDDTGGEGGIFATCIGLGILNHLVLAIRNSFWMALARMKADPRWSQIKSREDADELIKEYL